VPALDENAAVVALGARLGAGPIAENFRRHTAVTYVGLPRPVCLSKRLEGLPL
jgi:hypothetical protein